MGVKEDAPKLGEVVVSADSLVVLVAAHCILARRSDAVKPTANATGWSFMNLARTFRSSAIYASTPLSSAEAVRPSVASWARTDSREGSVGWLSFPVRKKYSEGPNASSRYSSRRERKSCSGRPGPALPKRASEGHGERSE
jgi:hypothetical protein